MGVLSWCLAAVGTAVGWVLGSALLAGGGGWGAEGWGRGRLGVTMANGVVLLSGAKPSPQTKDFSSCRNLAVL